jgi:ribosomal protein S18 acetylase RimI-like enzyme
MPAIDIVELTVDDLDELRPLWGELLAHHQQVAPQLADLGPGLDLDASWASRRAQYVDWFHTASGRLWMAKVDGQPAGYCCAHTAAGSNTWDWGVVTGVLETLVVSPRVRGTGLGTTLFNLARQYFDALGLRVLKISVMAGNDDALRLYRRLGAVDILLTVAMPIGQDR